MPLFLPFCVGVVVTIVVTCMILDWRRAEKRKRDEAFWIRVDVDPDHCAVCRLDAGQRNSIRLAQATRIVRTCEPHRERLFAFTFVDDSAIRLVQ